MEKGYNLFFLDQRGAGLSQTLSAKTVLAQGDPRQQAAYLKHFRADNIVRDCEAVRKAITQGFPEEKCKISLLGQSFGGFCATTYLSKYPEGLREVFMTGGLPPLSSSPDPVYAKLVARAAKRSSEYYERFPDDVQNVQRIAEYLKNNIETPSGGKLSVARLQAAGACLGFQSGFGQLHRLISKCVIDLDTYKYLTRPTISDFEAMDHFDDAIIYAILHEPIYNTGNAAQWSAERQLAASVHYGKASASSPLNFTTEMITHSHFADCAELRPLLEAAEILAADKDWPALYDTAQLACNSVPVFAAVYHDDLYVDFDTSMATAKSIKGCKVFISNMFYHDGIRTGTAKVLDGLFALRDDVLE